MNLETSLIELRQYTLRTGQRDALIELFEREFFTGQEDAGMYLIGQFYDLDRPDCFVWIRAFPNMEKRKGALEKFYFGAVWKAHREAANATMIDSDNVLLLKPIQGFLSLEQQKHKDGILVALIYKNLESVKTFYSDQLEPILQAAKAEILATYCTENSQNTFPRLPIRTETVFVCFARFKSESVFESHRSSLENLSFGNLELLRLRSTLASRL
jgi:hypothetical protein